MQFSFDGSNQRRRFRSRRSRDFRPAPPAVNPRSNEAVSIAGEEKMMDRTFEELEASLTPSSALSPLLSFSCQLAQGSRTLRLTNFSSVQQLFEQIAKGFSINPEDIIFCTINSPNVNMHHLFTSSIEPEDMLFAHVRGQPVEVELTKKTELMGVVMADNGGLGWAFIKAIKEGSAAAEAHPALAVGQLIESVQGRPMLGKRHYEVAKAIRDIPVGQAFTLRLVNPLTSGFNLIQPRNCSKASSQKRNNNNGGMGTIRFKSTGGVVVQTANGGPDRRMVEKLNELFDTYLGVQDDELAQTIWDTAQECRTLMEMKQKLGDSELRAFDFPDELVFDMWGIVGDLKRRAKKNSVSG